MTDQQRSKEIFDEVFGEKPYVSSLPDDMIAKMIDDEDDVSWFTNDPVFLNHITNCFKDYFSRYILRNSGVVNELKIEQMNKLLDFQERVKKLRRESEVSNK